MTPLLVPRPALEFLMPPEPRSRRSHRLLALVAFLGSAAVVGSAQPPIEEEEPGGKVTVKKRIVVDDEPGGGKKGAGLPTGNPPDVKLDELVRATAEARSRELKDLFARYTVPFDRITEASGATSRVKPIPVRKSEWPKDPAADFPITPLDTAGKPREERRVKVSDIRAADPFEALVLADADALVRAKAEPAAAAENLAAAEKLLAAALRFHEYARERQLRRGKPKAWDDVRDPLAARLREVRLDGFRAAVAENDAVRVRDAGNRLMLAYPADLSIAQEVAATRVAEADRLLRTDSHLDHTRARALLDEFELRFPGHTNEVVRQARARLKDMALKAFARAKEKKAARDETTAKDELARASALDPRLEGIYELQRELGVGGQGLRVGVWQYPEKMSPATARLDSEKQAVELLFEGLLEEVPGDGGAVRYRPGAALALPEAVPGGREFHLRAVDRDTAGRPGFDSTDVAGTMKLLRNRPDSWQAYPLQWLGDLPAPTQPGSVRLAFALGHPDPRATLTFKMLPARWMVENGKQADDSGFAERPFGTGPFQLYSSPPPAGGGPREMVFRYNLGYGQWRDRTGLPTLGEVRFVEAAKVDPLEAFRTGKLHVLPDVPTAEIDKYNGAAADLGGRVQVVKAAANRRVHVIAANLQRSYLQNKALRQGISMAVDRDDILDQVFRAKKLDVPDRNFHRPMTGPFPPGSWAAPQGVDGPPALLNRDLAAARIKAYLSTTAPQLSIELAYPSDDPRAEEACRRIKGQIEAVGKDGPDGRKLTIDLKGRPLRELYAKVLDERPGGYDLAYVPFDYPDDWYPLALGAALDPQAAGRGGRNCFGFLLPNTNPDPEDVRLGQALNQLRGFRDVAGKLAPKAAEVAKQFNDCLPFVPLWQLDRHIAVHSNLRVFVDDSAVPAHPSVLNPTTLFQNVARWRLD